MKLEQYGRLVAIGDARPGTCVAYSAEGDRRLGIVVESNPGTFITAEIWSESKDFQPTDRRWKDDGTDLVMEMADATVSYRQKDVLLDALSQASINFWRPGALVLEPGLPPRVIIRTQRDSTILVDVTSGRVGFTEPSSSTAIIRAWTITLAEGESYALAPAI